MGVYKVTWVFQVPLNVSDVTAAVRSPLAHRSCLGCILQSYQLLLAITENIKQINVTLIILSYSIYTIYLQNENFGFTSSCLHALPISSKCMKCTHSLSLMPPLRTSTRPSLIIDSVTFSATVISEMEHQILFTLYLHFVFFIKFTK